MRYFIDNMKRKWPKGRRFNEEVRLLQQATDETMLTNTHRTDHVKWLASSLGDFSVKSALKKIGNSQINVWWHKQV